MTRGKSTNKYTTGGQRMIPDQRMNISGTLTVPGAETTEMNRTDVYIAREEEIRHNKRRLRDVSYKTAATVLCSIAAVFAILILVRVGTKMTLKNDIGKLNSSLASIYDDLTKQEKEIAEARDSGRICYMAVQQMSMVNGQGADTVYITLHGTSGYSVSKGNLMGMQTGMNIGY